MDKQDGLTAKTWQKFYKLNNYYHKDIEKLISFIVPNDASVLEIGTKGGEILKSLPNKNKIGVSLNDNLFAHAKKKNPKIKFLTLTNLPAINKDKFDYIILSHTLSEVDDIQLLIKELKKISHNNTRLLVIYFNFLWKPIFDAAEKLGFRLPQYREPNWLSEGDVDNFFSLENFEKIKSGKRFIIPYKLPLISDFLNKYTSQLPIFNLFCLTNYAIYKPLSKRNDYSVSIVIPARNEAGNMEGVLNKLPRVGKSMEVIFVEGHSEDNTFEVIKEEIRKNKSKIKAKLYKQKGKGKGDAVRLGFSKANNELLMILDADLTVDPNEIPKFYYAIAEGKGELIIGSRLIYPMENQAMRVLNYFGNKFFSLAFTFLLGQRIKDTLCGTKVLLKDTYEKIATNRHVFGEFDPFGDYDLIFGAAKLNLKITEIPIRYKERTYGKTNISRFRHGLLLLKMVYFAAKNLKFV